MTEQALNTGKLVLPSAKRISKGLGVQLLALMAGFALSRTAVFGGYAPFGMAICMGLPLPLSVAGTVGAAIGYLIPVSGLDPFRYITAILAILVIRWLLRTLIRKAQAALLEGLIVFCAGLITGLAHASASGFEAKVVVMYAAESLIAGAAAFFFVRAFRLTATTRGYRSLTQQELTCCVISAGVILLSVANIRLFGVSPACVFTVTAILAAARYGRERGGAVAGIAAGFLLSLMGEQYLYLAAAYALGGLLAGVFSPMKNFGCAVAFILSNAVVALRIGATPAVISGVYEVFIGAFLFLVLPRAAHVRLSEFFAPAPEQPRLNGLRKSLVMHLGFAGAALSDVSATVDEVSKRLGRIHAPDFSAIFPHVEEDTCKNCALRLHCWETARAKTLAHMMDLTKTVRMTGRLRRDDLPDDLADCCPRTDELMQSVLRHFSDYLASEAAERRIAEVRGVVSDQFSGISDMLYDMAEEMELVKSADSEQSEKADGALKALGLCPTDIGCMTDRHGRLTLEIRLDNTGAAPLHHKTLVEELSRTLERSFDVPNVTAAGQETLVMLCEKAVFAAEFGVSQYACSGAGLCGDAYETFHDGRGRAVMILSDGMGHGGRAAVDGAMASGLMGRLLRAGFGYDCSLKIVNSAMLFKSTDESLATLDIVSLDLYSGLTEFYKAGACPTVIRKNGKTGLASCSSLPAGILREIGFDTAAVTLGEEDIILLLSDGAACEGTDWICAELEGYHSGGAQALADRIALGARRRRADGHEDDITVMATVIGKNY